MTGILQQAPLRALHLKDVKRFILPSLLLALLDARTPASADHKLQVKDPAAAQAIVAQGGRLIADYGGFRIYSISQLGSNLPDSVEVRDVYNSILLNAGQIDTSKPEAQALRKSVGSFSGKRMHLVHFAGPVQPAWRQVLLDAGAQIVSYIPENAYLVYGDSAAVSRVQAMAETAPHIQWDGAYLDNYKIHPNARAVDADGKTRKIGTDRFAIQLMADAPANAETLKLIDQLKLAPLERRRAISHFVDVVVRLPAADLARIAARPDVVSIQALALPKKVCERQDQIVAGNLSGNVPSGPGYLAWLQSKGFSQSQFTTNNFVVDVSDSGIDNGTTSPNHFGLYAGGIIPGTSRVVYNILQGSPNPGSTVAGCDGHGNLNTHIVLGFDNDSGFPFEDSAGYHYGLGVCPFVSAGSSVIFDPDNSTSPDDTTVISTAYSHNARISNNSWGDSNPNDDGSYNMDCFEYDSLVRDAEPDGAPFSAPGNQEMVVVFAGGNDGPGPTTVSPPGTAKNIITVGAAQNVQPFGGVDGSDVGNSGSDDANSIIDFSGEGPCSDGRHKPDIVAPGTHVSGGAPQNPDPGPDGTALACFLEDGSGVSGGVGTNNVPNLFYPNKQQFYTASSGTSHSTPCVTGGCALLRQYFLNNSNSPPSPAMTKAFLMNSARYMTGTGADDTLWSDSQGMGEMDLGMALDGTRRILRDELQSDTFTATGQTRDFAGVVGDPTKPFRVTVAWTDAPGSTSGNAYNNDLDLTVTINGETYKGNVFSKSNSIPGGAADLFDNVESVFLPAGTAGRFTVTVTAANIDSIGVPNGANQMNQDFALVIYNAGESATVAAAGYSLTSNEPCGSGAVYPGETVTLNLAVQNVGSSSTTNLVGTLLPYLVEQDEIAPGVTASGSELMSLLAQNQTAFPSGPATFPVIAPGATASNAFTFVADGSCGQTITATLQLQDGPADLGTVSYNIPLGLTSGVTNFTENFDEVTAPALPPGWSSAVSVQDGLLPWTTETTNVDTAPNAAFCPDSPDLGEVYLYSTNFVLPASTTQFQLTFRNNYNLEDGFDGGVLEIAIGANIQSTTFGDILAAGGSFVTGGYNGTIQTEPLKLENPLAGREAWTGSSSGFITTIVNLPPTASGQTIQLRWTLGTDAGNSTTVSGWTIDTVAIEQPLFECTNCAVTNVTAPTIVFPTNGYQFAAISPVVVVTGLGPTNSSVVISNNSVSNITAAVDANGVYAALTLLDFGTNVLTATEGGNSSAGVTVVIILGPPTLNVPTVANPLVAFSGTGAVGATVDLYQGTNASGTLLQTFTVNSSGNYSGTITLPLGTTTLTATETANGQTSTNTVPVTVSVVPLAPPEITSPTNGLAMNKPALAVSGDGVAGATLVISNVANGATTALASTTVNHSGRFSATVKVPNGTNVLFAVQEQNNITSPASPLVEVINYLVPAILVQPVNQTNFQKGSVTFTAEVVGAAPLHLYWEKNGVKIPGANGLSLTLSNLKTNAEAGYNLVASNQYGLVQSDVVALTLVPTNPFPPLVGTYYGLFEQTDPQFQSSGQITLSLTSMGRFSARILCAGGSYSYSGALSGVGWASNVISRGAALPPLTVVLDMNVTNGSEQILGTVNAGTNWTLELEADRATFNAVTNQFFNNGAFTMVFAGTNSGTNGPGGDGYATVKVTSAGMVSLAGVLPDNASFAPGAVSISKSGWWPLYAPLYGRFGSIVGWIEFTNTGVNILDLTNSGPCAFVGSNVAWFRTNADGKFYPKGFTNSFVAEGSAFAPANAQAWLSLPSLEASLSGGDLPAAESNSVTPAASGKLTASGSGIPGLSLKLTPATGVISGGFSDPTVTGSAPVKGILFPAQTNGVGFFIGATNSGTFLLTP